MVRLGILMMQDKNDMNYISKANYEWLTAAGIELIPILSTCTGAEAAAYFEYIHGFYISPGFAGEHEHPQILRLIRTFMVMAEKERDYFPVWGTCFGMQQLMLYVSRLSGLDSFNSRDYYNKIFGNITVNDYKGSRLLNAAPPRFFQTYLPWFNHGEGLTVSQFVSNRALTKKFQLLAKTHDRAGKEYVALIEARDRPWYGCQFHPEYHTPIRETMWIAQFIRSECEKSTHTGFLPRPIPVLRTRTCVSQTGKVQCLTDTS